MEYVAILLETVHLTSNEIDVIVHAVTTHESANNENDTPVQIALKDADRLANLDLDVVIRSGQFQPHLMAVDPVHMENDPDANYRDPRSVLWDVNNCISWTKEEGPYVLRLPKARKMGMYRAAALQSFIDTIKLQRAEIGLLPYPAMFAPAMATT